MLRYYFLGCLMAISTIAGAQASLPMPRDIQKAFKKGTRSADGLPGPNYWQNHGRYDINITVLPPDRNIKGTETITYINNSPDSLKSLTFKLFLNIHKPGAPRDGSAGKDYLTAGVTIDRLAVNGQAKPFQNTPNTFTILPVRLTTAVAPKDSVQLGIDWHYEISLQSGREGMIDSTTYFLAYFYPRVAVYDDYNGWDKTAFIDSREFYSDFNDYNVSIQVPKNYLVWGTGTLQQPEKLLQEPFLGRFKESFTSDQIVRITNKEELAAKNVTTQNETNTWQFKAANIPDMAFGLSDHFVWDAGSVVVDPATKRRASVQAVYDTKSADYRRMVEFGKDGLRLLSATWPGVPYPYEKTTVFRGFAGMEYPMMANDESYTDTTFSRFVAEHEIAHTYMPFYMGINETRYGFMDEGWATTFEYLLGMQHMGIEKASEFYKQFRVNGWIKDMNAEQQIPIITPGTALVGGGFGNNEYGKASLGYLAMKDLLGDATFKKCLHGYMDRWNGKHPVPWDFFNTFNNISGKNLNWFWYNWYFTDGYIDLALDKVQKTGSGYTLNIRNVGGFDAPVNVVLTYGDGSTETFHQTASIWQKNQQQATVAISTKKQAVSFKLDGSIFVDSDFSNNEYKMK